MQESTSTKRSYFSLDSILFYILSGLIFLLPILFVPSLLTPLLVIKYILLVLVLVIAVVLWILLRLRDGICLLPINALYLAGFGVLVITFVSTLLSASVWSSLFGQLPQTDTFIFFLYVFVLMFMIPSVFNTSKRILNLYQVFFVSLTLLALFQIARLFLGNPMLNFGYLANVTDNLLGKWNDLGIFFGLGALLSIISLEFLILTKTFKIILYIILAACLLLLGVINFSLVWYVLALISLIFFVYSIVTLRVCMTSATKAVLNGSFPVASFAVFLIAIIFIIGGTRISNPIANHFGISQNEVSTTWQGTLFIAQNTVWKKPIARTAFGVGPNRFLNEWLLFKPATLNNTAFWNTDINFGVGIVPSSAVTTGVLGLLSWAVFLGVLIYMGFRTVLFNKVTDPLKRYLVSSSFLASLYLWLFMVVYVPSLVIIVLAFFFTGLFIASLERVGTLKPVRFEYFKNPKVGFVSVLALILLLIGGLYLAYVVTTKFVASVYYGKAAVAINANDLDTGEQYIQKAINFDNNDVYARAFSQIYLLRLNNFLSNLDTKNTSADALKSQFTSLSRTALNAATLAISLDNTDYLNWLTLGDVYSALVPLKVDQAYANASLAYQKAFDFNPQNPYIYLELAKLDSAQNNADKAKGDVIKALTLKNDYTDAYMLLAQLQISEGDTKSAITSVSNAAYTSPQNSGLFFQLGVLYYNNKDYKNAALALTQAVSLNSQYSNAMYFLGLSDYQLGDVPGAIAQFTTLQNLNPGNQQVQTILTNLKAGKSPLGASPVSKSKK